MKKESGILQYRAAIIAAIIGAIATIFVGVLQYQKAEKESFFCQNIKSRSEYFKEKIDEKLKNINNDREEINHLFWREEFEKIMRYDCDEIKINFNEIMKSFEKSTKQLNL